MAWLRNSGRDKGGEGGEKLKKEGTNNSPDCRGPCRSLLKIPGKKVISSNTENASEGKGEAALFEKKRLGERVQRMGVVQEIREARL